MNQSALDGAKGEIVMYQPDETIRLEVRMEDETVWLNLNQLVTLFQSSKSNISEHIKNIYEQKELNMSATVRKFRTVQQEGNRSVVRTLAYYNLDAIISIGFRVNTAKGIEFRQWANSVLRNYLLKGYAINQRLVNLENSIDNRFESQNARINAIETKVDFFVRSSLPPVEGIFFDGQIFDAYHFVADLIRKATRSIVLIDNYVDDSVLAILDKRQSGVSATIYTQKISQQLQLDISKHNAQYPPVKVELFNKAHDRFLLIDDEVYHIGASIKDLGKKWFAFTLMKDITVDELVQKIQ